MRAEDADKLDRQHENKAVGIVPEERPATLGRRRKRRGRPDPRTGIEHKA